MGVRKSERGHRERLLEAAIVCLHEKGYARTTARDLVAVSGTNLASIGYHYGSKEHLLNVALTEAFQRWLKPLIAQAAQSDAGTPLERLGSTVSEVMGTLDENRALVTASLEAWAQLAHSEDLRIAMQESYDDFRAAIAETIHEAFADAGVEGEVDADALAAVLIALFDGLLVHWQLDPESVPGPSRLLAATRGAVDGLAAAGTVGR